MCKTLNHCFQGKVAFFGDLLPLILSEVFPFCLAASRSAHLHYLFGLRSLLPFFPLIRLCFNITAKGATLTLLTADTKLKPAHHLQLTLCSALGVLQNNHSILAFKRGK